MIEISSSCEKYEAIPTSIKTLLFGDVVEWARIEFKETWDAAASLKSICAIVCARSVFERGRTRAQSEGSRKGAERKQIQSIIKDLREEGLVERQGSNRSGKWVVKK